MVVVGGGGGGGGSGGDGSSGGGGGVEDGVDTFFGECDVVAITSADGFDSICFGDDNNIFLGECGGGGVEGCVDTFFWRR